MITLLAFTAIIVVLAVLVAVAVLVIEELSR